MAFIRAQYDGVIYDLDVLEDTPIRVDISAIENGDIGEVFGATSQGFTLPGSKKNNRFFKHAYKVGVTGVPGLGNSVDASVISKSDTLLEGSLFLDEVVRTPNGGFNYEVTITNSVVTFNDSIKTVAVSDLDWSDYDHTFSVANVTGSWTDNLFGGDVYYPLIDQGRDGLENTGSLPNIQIDSEEVARLGYINNITSSLQVQQLTPAIRVSTVLDKIFAQGEFTYSSSLQPLFDNLYVMPKQTENLSVKGTGFTDFTFTANPSSPISITTDSPTYVDVVFDNETDPAGAYDNTTGVYTAPKPGTYRFTTIITGSAGASPAFTDRCDVDFRYLYNGTTQIAFSPLIFDLGDEGNTEVIILDTGNINLNLNDTIKLQRTNKITGGTTPTITIETTSTNSCVDSPINYETGTIQLGQQFEPQTKCIDVLRGLIQKLNLVIEPVYTENRVLKIESFNNWSNSGKKVDWTYKIQNADRISLRSTLGNQQKTLTFEDNRDNDRLSKSVLENAEGLQWGTEVVNAASDVPQGERKVGAYFGPVILDTIPGTNDNYIPQLYKTDNSEIGRKTFKFKPRLGYKVSGVLPTGSFIGANSETFTDYATISNYDTLPVISGSTNNLHYNESFYPPAFDANATGSITSYKTYWSDYINDLYGSDSKILSAEIKFEPDEIADIELNDKIFVEDKWYRINKIKGYNLNYNDVVGLELITVNDAGFPNIVCDFDFSFETTTTTTTTTTTSTTTTTTTTTTAAPNKMVELSSFNSSSGEIAALNLEYNPELLTYQPIPTGSFITSSAVLLTGSLDFTSSLSNNEYQLEWITRWRGDGSLFRIGFGEINGDTGSISDSVTVDTNLYTTISVDWDLTPLISDTLTLYNISGSNGYPDAWRAFNDLTGSGTIAHEICIPNASIDDFYEPSTTANTTRPKAYGKETSDCITNYTDNIPARRFYVGEWRGTRVVVNYKTDTYGSDSDVYVERMYPQWRSPLLSSGSNNVATGYSSLNCYVFNPVATDSIYWDDNENPYFGGPFAIGTYTPVYTNAALTTQNCGSSGTGRFYRVTHSSGSLAGTSRIISISSPSIGGRPCSFTQRLCIIS